MRYIKRPTTSLGLTVGALLLSGCATTMAPKYTQPATPVPAAWPSGPAYREGTGTPSAKATADIPRQEFFVDQKLQKLIELALANNRDLKVAALNIERSRADRKSTRLNSSHVEISYAVFCLKKKTNLTTQNFMII